MNQVTVQIKDLKSSIFNVRPKHTKDDIKMMANSIKSRGIINPPSVIKNGKGFEIVAGNLRVEGARAAGLKEIICDDVSDLSDVQRIELSLAENIDRRQMTAIQEHAAFSKLFKSGCTAQYIANHFGKSLRGTQQILAIGSLPKKILAAAEAEEIGNRTLRCLAVAPLADVRRYMKLEKKNRPRDWEIQDWLAGEKGMYPAKSAIFDLNLYKGGSFVDLFDEDAIWLTDGEQFWNLQTVAINKKLEAFKKKGWTVEQVDNFQAWAYDRKAKNKGGLVIYARNDRSGTVEFHVGYKRHVRAGAATPAKGSGGQPEAKPEISQAFSAFIRQHRHNGVRGELLDDNKAALVVNICCMLKNHDSWRMDQIHMGAVKGDAYENDIVAGIDYAAIEESFLKICKDDNPVLLYRMSEKDLLNRLAIVTAWKWQTYSNEFSDKVAKAIGLKDVQNWKATDQFWKGIKNKATLIKIAKETGTPVNSDSTAQVIRAKLMRTVKMNGWRPKWLRFK